MLTRHDFGFDRLTLDLWSHVLNFVLFQLRKEYQHIRIMLCFCYEVVTRLCSFNLEWFEPMSCVASMMNRRNSVSMRYWNYCMGFSMFCGFPRSPGIFTLFKSAYYTKQVVSRAPFVCKFYLLSRSLTSNRSFDQRWITHSCLQAGRCVSLAKVCSFQKIISSRNGY